MNRIIECVPNFSEGRDMAVIGEITAAITAAADVRLLDVDPGEATNRTVVTFAGSPVRRQDIPHASYIQPSALRRCR